MFSKPEIKSALWGSLAGKLAMSYAVTTFSILLIASGFLYWSILDHLQREHQSLLSAKIIALRQYFQQAAIAGETLHDIIDVEHHHSQMPHSSAIHPGVPHHVFVRLFDEQQNLLIESNLIPALSATLRFPLLDTNENTEDIAFAQAEVNKRQRYLLGSAWATTQAEGQPRRLLIHVMLELAHDEMLLSEYQHTLIAVLLVGVLASALTGFMLTRRGLRPLHQITQTIQNINAQQLNERVYTANLPKEITLLAQAFDQMLARLDRSFMQLSQFSADLAHELRTPVNNLMGEAEVALSRPRTIEEYQQILVSNREECGRIARMIDELLFLARAEDPKTQLNCCLLQLEHEFTTIKEFYDYLALEKQIQIVCQANAVNLYADPHLLRRVLSNLMTNALRYSQSGSCITLDAQQHKETVIIRVIDQGEGIASELLPHIFDRFFRADKSRHNYKQGSGLGLAIVKSIMALHNGRVTVNSQLQQGTTVTLSFPVVNVTVP